MFATTLFRIAAIVHCYVAAISPSSPSSSLHVIMCTNYGMRCSEYTCVTRVQAPRLQHSFSTLCRTAKLVKIHF